MWAQPRNEYLRRFTPARIPNLRRLLGFQKQLIKELDAGGVPILAGTDAGGPPFIIPGASLSDELRELVSAGLTPFHALRGATAEAAHFLRKDSEFGTIGPGKAADLLLVRGNPLSDIENVTLRAGVMLRGRWLDNKALHAELDRIIRINRAEEAIVRALDRDGVAAALKVAKQIGARESSINELAYQFLRVDHEPGEALQLFRANVAMHPMSWQARESLAEAEK